MFEFLWWKWVKGYCRHFCIFCKWRRQCKLDRNTDKYIKSVLTKARIKKWGCFVSEYCYDCIILDCTNCKHVTGLCQDCLRNNECEMGDK